MQTKLVDIVKPSDHYGSNIKMLPTAHVGLSSGWDKLSNRHKDYFPCTCMYSPKNGG